MTIYMKRGVSEAKHRRPRELPRMLFANEAGEIMDLPDLEMAGRSGGTFQRVDPADLVPLPEGSELFVLPERFPVGYAPASGDFLSVEDDPYSEGQKARAVAAFVAPAYTSIYTAAFRKQRGAVQTLPLFAYTAVGWADGRFWVSAFRSDPDQRQDARHINQALIRRRTLKALAAHVDNRLIQHLGKCCLTYGCPAARNYFMGRWEAPLPTSPSCNAGCVGCISLQPSGCCPSTQDRIDFVPTPEEIADIAIPHIRNAERPVVSFGQGCEGEPLLQAGTIERAIGLIRGKTAEGTININTNASLPGRVDRLALAGLDSIRVSMNSARKEKYERYYNPRGYAFSDVLESIRVMKRHGKFVSINYFILPGFTDDPGETEAFCKILEDCRPDLIQLRNLNMDPDWYLETVGHRPKKAAIGMRQWLEEIKKRFHHLRFGYFNPYLGQERYDRSARKSEDRIQ